MNRYVNMRHVYRAKNTNTFLIFSVKDNNIWEYDRFYYTIEIVSQMCILSKLVSSPFGICSEYNFSDLIRITRFEFSQIL